MKIMGNSKSRDNNTHTSKSLISSFYQVIEQNFSYRIRDSLQPEENIHVLI